jgi:hypothetical protein
VNQRSARTIGAVPIARSVAGRRRGRRRRILTRALPIIVLAAGAFAAGAIVAGASGRAERELVTRYVDAWSRRDYGRMYTLLDDRSRSGLSEARFAGELDRDATQATLVSLEPLAVGTLRGGSVPVRVELVTRIFGRLVEVVDVRVVASGGGPRVGFSDRLLFPGLRAGEALRRVARLGPRASILAADGEPLAEGPARSSPIPAVAGEIVGTLGPIPPSQRRAFALLGYPRDARVGQDGLERIFEARLAGTPGGTLLAGRRVLASVAPVAGQTARTTIVPSLEQAAISALAGGFGGIVVMNPRTGALEALAGIAFSSVQPPGSTMKIVTASALLSAGLVTLHSTFPEASSATLDGYTLQNANGEVCGGTLVNAFAVSCNSVFAPLGAQLGASRLVAMAERFGFDQPPPFPGALESTIPRADAIGDSLAVGSSAIGQGMVQASPLEMTDVAATIADRGRRPLPTLDATAAPRFVSVITPKVAGELQTMMLAVVEYGTGQSAQIPGVQVAGKTGTAELRSTQGPQSAADPNASSAANTDAWFVAYAPAGQASVAVGALFPGQGAGGGTAAPAVRQVLLTALHRS